MGGSSKKQTVGYKYHLGMHKILCHGPVDYLLEIKVDQRLAWSGRIKQGQLTINKPSLFGGESREGGISGAVDFESGGPAQGVNGYLASKLSSLVPAFRGVAGVVLRQVYIGMNPYLKKWSFRAKRIHTRQNGLKQWYDPKAEINGDEFTADPDAYTQEYPGGTLYSITYDADTEVWLGAGSTPAYLRSIDGGKDWSAPIGPTGNASNEVAVSGAVAVCSSGDFSGCWVSYNGGASFSAKAIPAPFGTGNTRLTCVGYGNGIWMIGGQYAGQGYVTVSADSADTWSPIPGSGGQNYVGGYPVVSVCHVEGTRWLCCDSSGRVHVSTSAGAYWSETSKLFTQKLCKLPIGVVAIHTTPTLSISKDGGITWESQAGLPFQPFDVAHLGDMLVAVGAGGRIALSYDQGVSWETLPQTLANGNNLLSIASDGDGLAYAVGAGGTVAKIVITPARKGDMNPAHIIRECLTDPDWGMGYAEAEVDEVSFKAAADTLFAENFGLSLLWDRQAPIEDFIKEVLKHIDGALYVDRKTGLFTLKLIRGGYNAATLLELNESNIERVDNFTRTALGELTNSITVNYWSTDTGNDASVTVQDIALIQMQQATINTTLQYPGITNAGLASRVAQRSLKTLSTPRVSCTIYTTRVAKDLTIGDVFKLTWPDFEVSGMIMRVTEVAYGDGRSHRIRITCTQDTFDMPSTEYVTPDAPEWVDPVQEPQPVTKQIAFEVPYRELVQLLGQASIDSLLASGPEIGFVGVAAARPEGTAINARVYVDAGAGYEDIAGVEFCPTAELTSGVDRFVTVFPLTNWVDYSLIETSTWAQIGEELVFVTGIDATSVTVKRGVMDTVPLDHPTGARIYFWDAFAAGDQTEYLSGESLDIRITPVSGGGQVDLADATTMELLLRGRANRPYRPGNLKGNDEYQPGALTGEVTWPLVLTWAHRNRLQDTAAEPVGYYEGTVTSETSVTYSVRVVELDATGAEGAILHTETGITTETASIPFSVVELSEAPAFRVGVKAVRGGVESFTEARLLIPGALQAPTGLTATVETY